MDDLVNGPMEAKMKIQKRRMRPTAIRISEKTIPIISKIKIIEIREEEEEDKDLKEEASMEHVFTVEKKGIGHLNVLSAKVEQTGEMKARPELHM